MVGAGTDVPEPPPHLMPLAALSVTSDATLACGLARQDASVICWPLVDPDAASFRWSGPGVQLAAAPGFGCASAADGTIACSGFSVASEPPPLATIFGS